jgi:hypothetical protein
MAADGATRRPRCLAAKLSTRPSHSDLTVKSTAVDRGRVKRRSPIIWQFSVVARYCIIIILQLLYLKSNKIAHGRQSTVFSHSLGPKRPLASVDSNAGPCPGPCENHFLVHLGARLLQAIPLTRIKGSLRAGPLLFCCVLTSFSGVPARRPDAPLSEVRDSARRLEGFLRGRGCASETARARDR